MAAYIHPLEQYLAARPEVREANSYRAHWRTIQLNYHGTWNNFMESWDSDDEDEARGVLNQFEKRNAKAIDFEPDFVEMMTWLRGKLISDWTAGLISEDELL